MEGRASSEAAVRLEELWNKMLQSSETSLFCAYPIDVFGPDSSPRQSTHFSAPTPMLLPTDSGLEEALSRAMERCSEPAVEGLQV